MIFEFRVFIDPIRFDSTLLNSEISNPTPNPHCDSISKQLGVLTGQHSKHLYHQLLPRESFYGFTHHIQGDIQMLQHVNVLGVGCGPCRWTLKVWIDGWFNMKNISLKELPMKWCLASCRDFIEVNLHFYMFMHH